MPFVAHVSVNWRGVTQRALQRLSAAFISELLVLVRSGYR